MPWHTPDIFWFLYSVAIATVVYMMYTAFVSAVAYVWVCMEVEVCYNYTCGSGKWLLWMHADFFELLPDLAVTCTVLLVYNCYDGWHEIWFKGLVLWHLTWAVAVCVLGSADGRQLMPTVHIPHMYVDIGTSTFGYDFLTEWAWVPKYFYLFLTLMSLYSHELCCQWYSWCHVFSEC